MQVSDRLPAPTPTWRRQYDVVVVGSGVAGMMVALSTAPHSRVLLVTKASLDAGATSWAQGGIAAAVQLGDSPEEHADDTARAGVGLCDPDAVRVLAEEGPQRLAELMRIGARFDHDTAGRLELGREGGHGRSRIFHAGGDATGMEVQRALGAAVRAAPHVEVLEHAFAIDLLRSRPTDDGSRAVAGVSLGVVDEASGALSVGWAQARAVVLAGGGIGQVFATSTNPATATGDAMAMALRAGAALADMEFVQFHPTVLWQGSTAVGQLLLISEAVRGEGAVLVDATGARVMTGAHPMQDLAPRDVVSRTMTARMAEAPGGVADHLYLDATGIGASTLQHRFPTILQRCRALGIEPTTQPIPVAPGEHFSCGGISTDRLGRTSLAGLFAVGEAACSGVHGANRLASNGLLEGLVFGDRVGGRLVLALSGPVEVDGADAERATSAAEPTSRRALQRAMSAHAGVRRTTSGLATVAETLARTPLTEGLDADGSAPAAWDRWETSNIHAVASAIVTAARLRTESRGCHWRQEHPAPEPSWERRIAITADDGRLRDGSLPLTTTQVTARS